VEFPGPFRTREAGDYIAAIVLITAIILSLPMIALHSWGTSGSRLALLALLGLVPSIDAAIALVNRAVTRGMGATILPGLALREGIPSHLRTMIVVPALLTTRAAIEEHIERLEIHYLASPDVELHFALLSDWTDSPAEHAAGDAALLDIAVEGIARLNRLHGPAPAGDRFVLLHRRRVWSSGQRQWMGWERKRGKLHELNQLLRGALDTTFVEVGGRRPVIPPHIRYVITLDADTRLPRDTARRLVGKMAHPLNRPRFDAATGHVLEGYAVLQPRVAPSLPTGREGSLFQRVFSSASGIDPYAAAVSDVYQDLFGLGSYAGKGIYDVDAIELELLMYVPIADSIKICRLRLHNTSPHRRRLAITAYAEWVLGTSRGAAAPFLVTDLDPETGALFASNPWDAAFGTRVAFADLAGRQSQWTADRGEFLGRHGTLDMPAALSSSAPLSGRAGAGLDPCCALLTSIALELGQTAEVVFFLGEADNASTARSLLTRYRNADLDAVYREVIEYWEHVLSAVQVKTPDRSLDIILNRWILYQTLACRIWARTAFYQASGAYGFRDQLQDGMALAVARPDLTREHLLRAGGRQFIEGDLQHWWLPPGAASTGQGVRTRISDDVVWLAYCAIQYIDTTGDAAVRKAVFASQSDQPHGHSC
jgi:Glycosyltransferase family 36/Glycosyl hydrolase 36 superfamily, catalytic domain